MAGSIILHARSNETNIGRAEEAGDGFWYRDLR